MYKIILWPVCIVIVISAQNCSKHLLHSNIPVSEAIDPTREEIEALCKHDRMAQFRRVLLYNRKALTHWIEKDPLLNKLYRKFIDDQILPEDVGLLKLAMFIFLVPEESAQMEYSIKKETGKKILNSHPAFKEVPKLKQFINRLLSKHGLDIDALRRFLKAFQEELLSLFRRLR